MVKVSVLSRCTDQLAPMSYPHFRSGLLVHFLLLLFSTTHSKLTLVLEASTVAHLDYENLL